MKLTLQGLQEKEQWKNAGIGLPSYDIEKVAEETKKNPVWVHFGAGNIFRIFIGRDQRICDPSDKNFYRRDRRYADLFRRDEKRDYLCGNV